MSGGAWPDLLIGVILLIGAIKGFRTGFVRELAGAVALTIALITPWFYNGAIDPTIERVTHLAAGSAHVVGMFLTGIITYAIVIAISRVLDRVARLPLVNVGNALAGACIGLAKAAVLCWLILYVALFFPLSPDIRAGLHRSVLVAQITQYDGRIDGAVLAQVPWFARPFVKPFFRRHTP